MNGLEKLYKIYYPVLMRMGRLLSYHSEISKDTVNQVFLELWERKDRLPEVENIKSYLMTYFKRKLLGQIIESRQLDSLQDWHQETQTSSSQMEAIMAEELDQETKLKLAAAIKKLPKRQQEFLRLRFYDGMSHSEIAAHTGLTIRTIYNKLHEGINTLRKFLIWLTVLSTVV
jgi:RNA polymerase sigma-70 factor (ECF subfamily)